MNYRVSDIRATGLEAKWSRGRSNGPIIVIRNPNADKEHQRKKWWYVDRDMWARAEEVGLLQAFEEHTCLGDFFSIKV